MRNIRGLNLLVAAVCAVAFVSAHAVPETQRDETCPEQMIKQRQVYPLVMVHAWANTSKVICYYIGDNKDNLHRMALDLVGEEATGAEKVSGLDAKHGWKPKTSGGSQYNNRDNQTQECLVMQPGSVSRNSCSIRVTKSAYR